MRHSAFGGGNGAIEILVAFSFRAGFAALKFPGHWPRPRKSERTTMEVRTVDVVSRVLKFWYDKDAPDLAADGDYRMAWFKKDDAFDQAIRKMFVGRKRKEFGLALEHLHILL